MRKYISIVESADTTKENPNIVFDRAKSNKVVAFLKSYDSARYTKLANNMQKIAELKETIDTLQEETKSDTKELIAALFEAEDAASTRVVDTVSFIFTLSKDPDPTTTVKYKDVLTELEQHLTPELREILENLKKIHSSTTKKEASLRLTDKNAANKKSVKESITSPNVAAKVKELSEKVNDYVLKWAVKYDKELRILKSAAEKMI